MNAELIEKQISLHKEQISNLRLNGQEKIKLVQKLQTELQKEAILISKLNNYIEGYEKLLDL